jgi:pimeloyl-ACP methyl ester carboxylesterase
MKALGLSKAHLVGYSYGGLVALYTAMNYPERVGDIAIIESPNPNDDEPRKLLEKYSRESLEQYTRKLSESTHLNPSRRHMEKLHKIQQYLLDNTTIVNDITQNVIFFQNVASAHIPNKTLLLYANESECKDAGEFLHRHIKDSRLFFGEGDHNLPVQNPDWVAEKLYDFYTGMK